jgi:hypothetical protein
MGPTKRGVVPAGRDDYLMLKLCPAFRDVAPERELHGDKKK